MTHADTKTKFLGAFIGTAVGDALGAPFEGSVVIPLYCATGGEFVQPLER
jgi:uncharacterized protein YqgC (DUF456 family)